MNYKEKIYKNYGSLSSKNVPEKITYNFPRIPFFNHVIKNFFPNNKKIKIIDLGCGFGDFVWLMQKKGYQDVIGVDNSLGMIKEGQRLNIKNLIKENVFSYIKKTPSNSVDIITAIDLIEHIDKENLSMLVSEIHRVLKYHGKFISHQPNGASPFVNTVLYGDFTHEQAFTKGSISQLFLSNGFEDIETFEVKPIIHGFKSLFRHLLWSLIVKNILLLMSLPETGVFNRKQVLTRNFFAICKKRKIGKILVYAPHPVQYHAPIFREIAKNKELDLTVMFGDDIGLKEVYSPGLNTIIKWDIPLTNGYKNFFLKNIAKSQITVDGFSIIATVKRFFSRINLSIFSHVDKKDFDYVLIHGYQTFTCWLIMIAARMQGMKIIFRGESILRKNKFNLHRIFTRLPIKYFLKHSNAVMYSCSGNYQYWLSLNVNKEKLFSMPCAVDNKFFLKNKINLKSKRKSIREKFKIYKNDLVIIFPSKFINRKRPFDLIEAVKLTKNKNIILLFVGDGPNRNEMEKKCSDYGLRSIFTGFINQGKISKYYLIADIVAIISDYDASPKSLNEALNFGLVPIVSDMVGTANDLVIENYNGFITEVGNISDISEKILTLFDKDLLKKYSKNSEALVKKWNLESNALGLQKTLKYLEG